MSLRPKPQRLSLLLADVDGTLVEENKILSDRATAAVGARPRRGVRLAVTSGRPESILRPSTQLNGMICSMVRRTSASVLSTPRRPSM